MQKTRRMLDWRHWQKPSLQYRKTILPNAVPAQLSLTKQPITHPSRSLQAQPVSAQQRRPPSVQGHGHICRRCRQLVIQAPRANTACATRYHPMYSLSPGVDGWPLPAHCTTYKSSLCTSPSCSPSPKNMMSSQYIIKPNLTEDHRPTLPSLDTAAAADTRPGHPAKEEPHVHSIIVAAPHKQAHTSHSPCQSPNPKFALCRDPLEIPQKPIGSTQHNKE
jgi:hypothetical protein